VWRSIQGVTKHIPASLDQLHWLWLRHAGFDLHMQALAQLGWVGRMAAQQHNSTTARQESGVDSNSYEAAWLCVPSLLIS
jgi:hypothetical protein